MRDLFDVDNSSLEASVKAYHKKVVEPLHEKLENMQGNPDIPLDNLITKENIGEQSVKYAESAGTVDWSDISNIPPNLPASSDPSATTDHSHANKPVLDKFSTDDNGNVLYGGKEMATVEQYTSIKETVDDMSTKVNNAITKENIGEQSVKYAESAGSIDWDAVKNKPAEFPTGEHSHTVSDITDFPESMPASDVPNWAKTESKPEYSWDEIKNKPTEFPTTPDHTHDNKEVLDVIKKSGFGNKFFADDGEYKEIVLISPTEPSDVHVLWIDSSDSNNHVLKAHNGTKWVTVGAVTTGSANITVDDEMSDSSTNPVQNKVIKEYVDQKESVTVSQEEGNVLEVKDDGLYVNASDIVGKDGEDGVDGKSAYEVWLDLGNTGTEEDFINSLRGKDGIDGIDGADGKNGEDGTDGKSVYDIWLELGNTGSEEDFINSLRGKDGIDGIDGVDGEKGENGTDGEDGKSAYEVWLELGNTGSEENFINSLKGKDGADGVNGTNGTDGKNGVDGADGKSAYEVWLELGNTGSEENFINSLKGKDSKSAYETWLELGNTGTEEDFINSLKGETGETGANGSDGESAYETWLSLGNEGTEEDFINSLKGSKGEDANSDFVLSVDENGILCVTYDDGVTE